MRLPSDKFVEGVEARPIDVEMLDVLFQLRRSINQLTIEVKNMTDQETRLAQVVTDLTNAFNDNVTAVAAEIESLKGQITPGADPVVDNNISALQALVITMQKNTAAAQAAVQPPPTPVSTGDSSGDAAAEPPVAASDATGDAPAEPSAAASDASTGATA